MKATNEPKPPVAFLAVSLVTLTALVVTLALVGLPAPEGGAGSGPDAGPGTPEGRVRLAREGCQPLGVVIAEGEVWREAEWFLDGIGKDPWRNRSDPPPWEEGDVVRWNETADHVEVRFRGRYGVWVGCKS